ncbi:NPCBM/NEW2 domain protein [Novipirellula aureliae]|uniref:NPCBM/NEW2 domain protein n=1 Tax=Novipirellula aureliae TaxID=2527966 RepID=A0A5C6DFH8_9BACT|nr:NPCBM/NEW2 domain-containing protein [Novipirellula aureliae]TWU34567.1 NPCBM/NEW2 domain protein [Novipirellula aureliae]
MLIKLLFLTLLAGFPVRVSTTDGKWIEGELRGIGESELLLQSEGAETAIAFSELTALEPIEEPTGLAPKPTVTLVGGSVITAQGIALAGDRLTIEPRRQAKLDLAIDQVRAIRFQASNQNVDPVWFGKFETERRGDTLVIRREGDQLDFVDGLVVSITDSVVKFDIDGEVIDAPIGRLEGVLFGGSQSIANASDIQIVDVYNSRWSVSRLEPSELGEPLRLVLSNSLEHRLPLEHIESIRWSGGLSLLAQMEPAEKSFTPAIKTNLDSSRLDSWFSPKADADQDLILIGKSSVDYRIEDGYTVFAAGVRRDRQVSKATKSIVRIRLDGKLIWEQSIVGEETFGFELPIDGGNRLTIETDIADDGEIGDIIRILLPRLLR